MAVADGSGFPVAVSVASPSPHELRLIQPTLDAGFVSTPTARLIGDNAYDSDALDERLLAGRGIELIAPNRSGRDTTQDGRPLRR